MTPQPLTYAERTYASPHWIVRFPHQRRYSEMTRLVAALRPSTVLDFGAGDGYWLISLLTTVAPDTEGVAYETALIPNAVGQLTRNLAEAGLADRVQVASRPADIAGPVDLILCMGVLEHMTLAARHEFYDTADRVLAPGGTIAIDVPVEVGPALVVKNLGRRLLKRDSRQYRLAELARISLGGRVFDPERFTPRPARDAFTFHQGFDHRLLRAEVASRFDIVEQRKTPINWLPVALNQEVVLLARRRG